jgi:preprotein translocase subunit YajC
MPTSSSFVSPPLDFTSFGLSAPAQVAPAPQPPGAAPPPPAPIATQGAPAPSPQQTGGPMAMLLNFALPIGIFVAFYFFFIRPQQTKEKELSAKLKKGDRVVTQSGLIGKIYELGEREAKLELAPNLRVDILRASISAIYEGTATSDAKDARDAGKAEKK